MGRGGDLKACLHNSTVGCDMHTLCNVPKKSKRQKSKLKVRVSSPDMKPFQITVNQGSHVYLLVSTRASNFK